MNDDYWYTQYNLVCDGLAEARKKIEELELVIRTMREGNTIVESQLRMQLDQERRRNQRTTP